MYGANQFVAKCYQCQILTEQLCTVHLVSQPDTIFANYLQTNHLRTGCVFRLMLSPPTSDNLRDQVHNMAATAMLNPVKEGRFIHPFLAMGIALTSGTIRDPFLFCT